MVRMLTTKIVPRKISWTHLEMDLLSKAIATKLIYTFRIVNNSSFVRYEGGAAFKTTNQALI